MTLPLRQSEIVKLAHSLGRVTVDDLARRFEVSAQTIRKDLNDLCERRALSRVHGGAVVASGVENLTYAARRFVAAAEKRAIGARGGGAHPQRLFAVHQHRHDDRGSRARARSHEGLLVITNNLNVAMQLYPHPRIEVIVAGGSVRRADGAVVGEASNKLIQQFKVDFAVVGASAIDEDGALLDFDYREVQAAQAIIANARHVILVADSTKFQPHRTRAHRPYQPGADLRHRSRAARGPAKDCPGGRHRRRRGHGQGRSRGAAPGLSPDRFLRPSGPSSCFRSQLRIKSNSKENRQM